MKYTILIALALLASPLVAQQPSISYLMCDEAKSQLQIRGSFGIDSGRVSIEDTTLGIVSWSDSLIICNLPDSGTGAGGGVIVKTINGTSNKRILSIFRMTLSHTEWQYYGAPGYQHTLDVRWNLNWRCDILGRDVNLSQVIPFEISKSSTGAIMYFANPFDPNVIYPWIDSSNLNDSSISLKGVIDLQNQLVSFYPAQIRSPYFAGGTVKSKILNIMFDAFGNIKGYTESYEKDGKKGVDSVFNIQILFPPSIKNAVPESEQTNIERILIISNKKYIELHSDYPLGKTTASLYTIDGRLLKRTKLDITAPGIFSIDVSDVHTHFAILVLQTEKGIITKKILF